MLRGVSLISYENRDVNVLLDAEDADLHKIFDAAVRTFRQNAVDILTDCPSRERAGWLCDSYFTARAEFFLTGENKVEYNFLRSICLAPDPTPKIPKGMIPMCYPSDHYDGNYIVNWALWLVLELEDYQKRSKDKKLIDDFQEKIMALFSLLKKYENEYGLLEDVGGWVFVDWSRANDFTNGVNFPSNMLYAAALESAGRLYKKSLFCKKAEKLRNTIRSMSFNGLFFSDQALRRDGKLCRKEETTETCQYYAFYFGIADKSRYPSLYRVMLSPREELLQEYPQLYPSNAFIGIILRLDYLYRQGEKQKLLLECKNHFLYMAQKTGTLWEHIRPESSCCHAFASIAALWIYDGLMQM